MQWKLAAVSGHGCRYNCLLTQEMRGTYLNVKCEDVSSMLSGKSLMPNFTINLIPINDKTLIMPYSVNNLHWVLILADVKKRAYRCFDSLNLEHHSQWKSNFLAYLKSRNNSSMEKIQVTGWKLMPFGATLPTQGNHDTNNCGVYILMYVFHLLQKGNVNWNAEHFRKNLAFHILRQAPNMKYLCGFCGEDEFPKCRQPDVPGEVTTATMIRCETCRRWFHHHCDESVKAVPYKEVCSDSFTYKCELCTKFQQTR